MAQLHSLPTLQKPTLSAQVARHLLDLVAKESLRPGDFVPSEVQICKTLQVSRGSVREAYRTLAALGILEIESGRRPRLQSMNSAVLAQVFGYALSTAQLNPKHVIETRRAIEVQGAQLAARNVTDVQKVTLKGLVAQMRSALSDRDHAPDPSIAGTADRDGIAGTYQFVGFCRRSVDRHLAAVTRLGGEGSGPKGTRGAQPTIDAQRAAVITAHRDESASSETAAG